MGFLSRLLGRCRTPLLEDSGAWRLADRTLELDLGKVPVLAPRGGAVRIEAEVLPERVLVVHGEDDAFHAFPNRCKHGGRRIDPLAGAPRIECCSVGKSTWDYGGTRQSGSATEDLPPYPVERDGQTLRIDLA